MRTPGYGPLPLLAQRAQDRARQSARELLAAAGFRAHRLYVLEIAGRHPRIKIGYSFEPWRRLNQHIAEANRWQSAVIRVHLSDALSDKDSAKDAEAQARLDEQVPCPTPAFPRDVPGRPLHLRQGVRRRRYLAHELPRGTTVATVPLSQPSGGRGVERIPAPLNGLHRGFIAAMPVGGPGSPRSRNLFPDKVARALADEANLRRLATATTRTTGA
ncbi:hypothetical protein ACWD8L_24345 [Streptomyces sp. NPDC005133]